jgi:DNA (cytosine-5)-methyltransferase 1
VNVDVEFRVPSPEIYSDADVTAKTGITSPPIALYAPNHEFTRQSPDVVERLSYAPGRACVLPRVLEVLPERLRIKTKTTLSTTYKRLRTQQACVHRHGRRRRRFAHVPLVGQSRPHEP